MELTGKLLTELQNRLKVGNRRGVHLNAIPSRSRYKFDLGRLSYIDKNLPQDFINALLTEQPLKFRISWKDNVPDISSLFEEDQQQLVKITQSFENLINQTEAIESEKGINTFGFGFPLIARRDQADNKLTVAPILIWSLRIKRTKEFNTWVIQRNEDDPIYLNEVLINHLQNDSKINIDQISSEMLDDGLIDMDELLDICVDLIKSVNSVTPENIRDTFRQKLDNVKSISTKNHFEKLSLTSKDSLIEFSGLFSIFEVQKQSIINDYEGLLELDGMSIDLEAIKDGFFQSLSSVETDPSQQSILHALESKRNILIQGPPGTGKSQSLAAVLVNALENNRKTIVVCEKQTALEVLHNALNKNGLGSHSVLIKDIIKDRRTVVNSVRDRIDSSSFRKAPREYSHQPFWNLTHQASSLIDSINRKHKKIGQKIFENNNWTGTVGLLLSELKSNNEDFEFDNIQFEYTSKELNELLKIARTGRNLYKEYEPFEQFSFINSSKLVGENPFLLERNIEDDFKNYSEKFHGENSAIRALRTKYSGNTDLFNLKKTKSIGYRLSSLFSKSKKVILKDQRQLFQFCNRLAINIEKDGWPNKCINKKSSESIINDIESLFTLKERYFNHEDDLFSIEFNWFKFYNSLTEQQRILIDNLSSKENWEKVLLIFYLNSLLVNSASTDLPTGDREHEELRQSLSQIGKKQLRYIKSHWSSRQISATRDFNINNPNLNVENLYNKRSSHKHRRLSMRQIVRYDPDLFTTFFPIILTTPDVCSNLFKGMNKYFDIVLFDEASQLKLEDNLPALLKGRQIIIAGDEHQMPPSSYFSKIFDGTIEDEDEIEEDDEIRINQNDILLSCESLLDFGGELSFEKKYLDFHYRSKHPYLIDFSNHAFYNRRLKPIPSDFDYTPIKYIPVDGTYSDHSNEREAETVLSILENNIHRMPNGEYPSVGIATFNIAQRNLIKSKILERQKFERYAEFNNKIIELDEGGLFVKNLENIQGDERDVIILSTTYGVGRDGRFAQRFGPINHKKGYKLLNVIITRAKYKVYVCSSVPEQVFLNYKEHLVVEGGNNRRAVFFAYLAYAKAISQNDEELRQAVINALAENSTASTDIDSFNDDLESPFEEEVYQRLSESFDESKLIPQLQFAGFRIDIVYDPKIDGVPKIAIECDGAAYHSSKEAYLHDNYRQKILEDHGFVFHRIWSTNWWRNPERETRKLVDFIKKIENSQILKSNDKSNIASAFTDQILDSKEVINRTSQSILKETKAIVESLNEKRNKQIEPNNEPELFDRGHKGNKSNRTWESLTCCWSENKMPGYRYAPNKNAWYRKKDLDEENELGEGLTKTLNGVQSGSIVRLKYLNNGQNVKVQLLENATADIKKSNGIQRINSKSPLGASLIGKNIGETVKVGNLDNYVEILEISN